MATYVNDLRLKEIATGDEAGTWGDSTNTNLELIAEAFSYGTEASFGSDADATTTIADGSTDPARSLYLKVTSGASLTATRTLTIAPNTVSKVWIIENATSGSQSINISQGSGANVTIPSGKTKIVYSDGAGSGAAVVDALASLNLETSGIIETSSSIQTPLIEYTDGDDAMTIADGGQVTFAQNIIGTLDTAAQPNITSLGTITSLVATSADINGGTIDGVTIGGASAGAITGTTITGTGFVSSGNMTFGDSDKAIFGAGSDLEIYHDGSDSYIKDAGTGVLYLQGSSQVNIGGADGTIGFQFVEGANTALRHNNSLKLSTTSTGIDVTGTITADGLTVDSGGGTFTGLLPTIDIMELDTTDLNTRFQNQVGDFSIRTLSDDKATITRRFAIDHATGDISFYDDTGVSPALFWDASAESLGIGTTSPQAKLDVSDVSNFSVGYNTFSGDGLHIQCSGTEGDGAYAGGISFSRISSDNNTRAAGIAAVQTDADADRVGLAFFTHPDATTANDLVEAMRIDSSGNVGIGTDSPSSFNAAGTGIATVSGTGTGASTLALYSGTTSSGFLYFSDGTSGAARNQGYLEYSHNNNDMRIGTAGTERVRIDSDGNVGIGTTSPSDSLEVEKNFNGETSVRIGNSDVGASSIASLYLQGQGNNFFLRNYGDGTTNSNRTDFFSSASSSYFTFSPTSSEAMRITSAGNLLVGTTTTTIGTLGNANAFGVAGNSGAANPMVVFAETDASVEVASCILELSYSGDTSFSTSYYTLFSDSGGTQGTISGNGGGTVAYNTSSDERIKENIVDTGSQLETIKQIQVRDFNYIGNDTNTTGMIAQELNTILPNVVQEGGEDATKHPWGIDYAKLTPYLIKAIQEQQTIIDDLKSRIETLEG